MSNIDKYTKFMSEQAKSTSTGLFGTHKTGFVAEADNKSESSDEHKENYNGLKEYGEEVSKGPGHHIIRDEGDRGGILFAGKVGEHHISSRHEHGHSLKKIMSAAKTKAPNVPDDAIKTFATHVHNHLANDDY